MECLPPECSCAVGTRRNAMAVRVGINGFGRIGRNIMRAALGDKNIDFVAVNDLTERPDAGAPAEVRLRAGQPARARRGEGERRLPSTATSSRCCSMRDPAQLPWKDLGVDVVFESTGLFTGRDDAAKHLAAGAKKVIITAPAKGAGHHGRARRQRREVRPGEASHHLQRLVHDQLPGAARQGAARALRHQARAG